MSRPLSEPDVVDGYVSGPAAATEPRRQALEAIEGARKVILVEGVTDQIAIDAVAAKTGRSLADEEIVVAPMGGAHAVDMFLDVLIRVGIDHASVRGVCDDREGEVFRSALERVGFGSALDRSGMERLGFYVCTPDLEAELIRAMGPDRVLGALQREGEISAFRTLQQQSAWSDRTIDAQLHRFCRAKARRMHRYARIFVEELDVDEIPRPLLGVVGRP